MLYYLLGTKTKNMDPTLKTMSSLPNQQQRGEREIGDDGLARIGRSAVSLPGMVSVEIGMDEGVEDDVKVGGNVLVPPPGFEYDEDAADMGQGYEEQVQLANPAA